MLLLQKYAFTDGLHAKCRLMSVMRRVVFMVVLFIGLSFSAAGQDPIFSQFFNAPISLNAAFAGNTPWAVFRANYRNQWPGLANVYNTYAVSYDQFFDDYNSGVGLMVLTDDAGDGILKTSSFMGAYSYRIRLDNNVQLKFGIDVSYAQWVLNWDKLVFGEQLDPSIGGTTPGGTVLPNTETRPRDLNNGLLDLGTGFLLYNSKFYGGLSIKHINTPTTKYINSDSDSYVGLPLRFTLQAGGQINFDSRNKSNPYSFLSPNVLYVRQGSLNQLNVGAIFGYSALELGGWLRHDFGNSDAMIASVGVRTEQYKIMYSFDYTISGLGLGVGNGAHEVGLMVGFGMEKYKRVDLNDCFSIFR